MPTEEEEEEEEEEEVNRIYTIRPPFSEKFNSVAVKEMLKSVLYEELDGKRYNSFKPNTMINHLGSVILEKLQDFPYQNYKFIVKVVIAEQKGQGLQFCSTCFWDCDTDGVSSEFFISEHLICIASVFATYYY